MGKKQITEGLAGTVGIHSLVNRSLSDQFVPTHSRRRKGFEPIINAVSSSFTTAKKQCRCSITLMYCEEY